MYGIHMSAVNVATSARYLSSTVIGPPVNASGTSVVVAWDERRGRDQHPERLAPDHHAAVVGDVYALRQRIRLTALERVQAAEIDVHGLGDFGRRRDALLGNQVHMKFRAGTDLEVAF